MKAKLKNKHNFIHHFITFIYFFKNDWPINEVVLKEKTGLSVKQSLRKALGKVSKIQGNQALQGLGELLDNKEKAWVKENLIPDTIFQLSFGWIICSKILYKLKVFHFLNNIIE